MTDFSGDEFHGSKIRNLGSLISDEARLSFLTHWLAQFPVAERLLDVGCGARPYALVYQPWAKKSYGVDVPFTTILKSRLDAYSDAQFLPFANRSFAIVVCAEVMEHVPNPSRMLSEISRILFPGGQLYLTTPFLVPEHDAPYDFYRYTRYGLEYLLKHQGFRVAALERKGDLLGVSVAAWARYQLKIWRAAAKILRLDFLATVRNPLVWLGVWLPQKVYLLYFRKAVRSPHSMLGKLHQVFAYGCLGFTVVAIKD